MNISELGPIVKSCKIFQFEDVRPSNNFPSPVIYSRDVLRLDATDTIEAQIRDFLEGRTHGEDLLHVLHDHVLDEPIPERMRALFRAGSAD